MVGMGARRCSISAVPALVLLQDAVVGFSASWDLLLICAPAWDFPPHPGQSLELTRKHPAL